MKHLQHVEVLITFILAACGTSCTVASNSTGTSQSGDQTQTVVLVGAGDIAECGSLLVNAQATANLLGGISGAVFADGDLAYPDGTDAEFANCYNPTWGAYKARTIPVVGNHEYDTPGAAGYFNYWGTVAHPPTGYYSTDLGAWHLVILNSQCSDVGGCLAGSPQEQWLRADLAAHPVQCTIALWHIPLFTANPQLQSGLDPGLQALWQALFDLGADVVVNGHNHSYERFAPQDPNGTLDPQRGIREFIVGTGGAALGPLGSPAPNSEVQNNTNYGVLKLSLHPTSYDWEFVPVPGGTFTDSGSDVCH